MIFGPKPRVATKRQEPVFRSSIPAVR